MKSTVRPVVAMSIVTLALAVCPFMSVAVSDTVKVPAEPNVVVKLAPDPLAGLPPVAVQSSA